MWEQEGRARRFPVPMSYRATMCGGDARVAQTKVRRDHPRGWAEQTYGHVWCKVCAAW
jgi:hypothetical protein